MKLSVVALAVSAAVFAAPALADKKISAATWLPAQIAIPTHLYTYWAEKVEEYSNGEMSVELNLGSPITTPIGSLKELGDGIVDVTGHFAAYTPSDLPHSAALEELGMLFTDTRVIIAASTEFNITDARLQAEWESHNVVFGSSWASTPYMMFCNKPIVSLEDMKGANMRLPGRAAAEWAASVGAVVVPLSSNEQYSALDTGILTCTTTLVGDALSRNLSEVALHATDLPITVLWAGIGHGYNAQSWAKFSVDERSVLMDAEADGMASLAVRGMIQFDAEARVKMEEQGVTFHQPSEDLIASIDEFKSRRLADAAVAARENLGVENPETLLNDFLAVVSKWEILLSDVPVEDYQTFAELMREEIYRKVDHETYGTN